MNILKDDNTKLDSAALECAYDAMLLSLKVCIRALLK